MSKTRKIILFASTFAMLLACGAVLVSGETRRMIFGQSPSSDNVLSAESETTNASAIERVDKPKNQNTDEDDVEEKRKRRSKPDEEKDDGSESDSSGGDKVTKESEPKAPIEIDIDIEAELSKRPPQPTKAVSQKPARLDPHQQLRKIVSLKGLSQTSSGARPRSRRLEPKSSSSASSSTKDSSGIQGLRASYRSLDQSVMYYLSTGADLSQVRSKWGGLNVGTWIERIDPNVDFPTRESFALPRNVRHFGAGSLWTHWMAEWRGRIHIEQDRKLVLIFGSDIAGFVEIDGQTVLFNDQFAWYKEVYAELEFKAGVYDIKVVHFEGPSHNDKNNNSACRLMYKDDWEDQLALPVPFEWFSLNSADQANTPVISSRSALRASSGDQLTLNITNSEKLGLNPQVFIGDQVALSTQLSNSRISFIVPPGAESGLVEVRGDNPSNTLPITIEDKQGVVAMVWDLTGYARDFVDPASRPPDFAAVMDNPLPITVDTFPAFRGKPIAVRIEGKVAAYEHGIVKVDYNQASWRAKVGDEERSGGTAATGSTKWPALLARTLQHRLSASETVGFSTESFPSSGTLSPQLVVSLTKAGIQNPVDLLFFNSDSKSKHVDLFSNHQTREFEYRSSFSIDSLLPVPRRWVPFTLEALMIPEDGAGKIDFRAWNAPTRASDFTPGRELADPPQILRADGKPLEGSEPIVTAVGEKIKLYVDIASLSHDGGNSFRVAVDGVAAQWKLSPKPSHAGEPNVVHTLIEITIPDGAGEGRLYCMNGIVSAPVVNLNITNRGLVGLYYDYDNQILAIPDNSDKAPVMRRVDSHLHFESNVDFALPMPAERFAVEWFGQIRIPADGEYTFHMQSDDGARVTIDDAVAVAHPNPRSPGVTTGKIKLSPGWHDIHIEFYENNGVENFVLKMIAPGETTPRDIDARDLRPQRIRGIPDKYPPGS